MIGRPNSACSVHRPALVDFVERRATGPDSPAAFDHLARCTRCEQDLTEVAQTVIALRRLGERASRVEPPPDGWNTLRERIERSQRAADDAARRFRRAFGGAVASIAVIGVVAVASLGSTVTTGLRDGLGVAPAAAHAPAASDVRRYDPRAQPLTEGIVLAIAGREAQRVALAEWDANGPISTDRRDRTRPAASLPTITQPTAPRTALRT
jgi:hypothetical protein